VFRVLRNYTKQIKKIIVFWPSEVTKTHVFRLKTHIFRWKWWIFAIFGPIWTQFRSKHLKIRPGSHFQSNRLDRIDPDRKLDKKWPFLVRFGLNLGLNNLKFDQEAISNRIDSIGSTWSDRSDRIECKNGWFLKFDQEAISDRNDSIGSIG